MSTLRQAQLQSRTQYISLEAFDQHIYTYTYNIRTKLGSLALTGVSAANAAGRVLLRDTGRRLNPGANNGVSTPMISIGFVGASDGLAYNGFIDPQLPDIFAHYTEHGSFSNPVSGDLYTSGTNTTGDITTTGVLTVTGGSSITGGLTVVTGGVAVTAGGVTVTAGGLDVVAGGMDISGTVNINTGSSGVTTINTGGTGATNIGNASGNTALTGTLTTSGALTVTAGGMDVLAGGMDVSGTVNVNTGSSGVTTIGTGGTGATNIGNATGNTALTGTLTTSGALTVTAGGMDVLAGGMDVSGTVNVNISGSGVTTINTGGTGATNIGNASGGTTVTGPLTASNGLSVTTGSITLEANSAVASGTGATSTVPVNGITGTITTDLITTAAGFTHVITLTNTTITTSDNRIFVSIKSFLGTGIPIIASATCTAASTAEITIRNIHSTDPLGRVVIDFIVIR